MKRCERMDKLDFAILNVLQENESVNRIQTLSRKEMLEALDINKVTLYKRIKNIINQNYIAQGLNEGREHTYYITKEGIKLLQEELG